MSSTLLQIDNLALNTARGQIVKDFSLTIHKGEIIALTGKSGSGKTSIAMAILGLLNKGVRQTAGQISFTLQDQTISLPKDQEQWPMVRGTHIGFVQQDVYGTFDPILRIGDQMTLVVAERSNQSNVDAEKEIRVKMEEVGLADVDRLWNSYPHQLSGGQLQRCQICMAIAIHPELLLVDEPTSAIDKINQAELLDVFSKLREKYGIAILCITHEEFVVKYLADREVRMGEIDPLPNTVKAKKENDFEGKSLPVLIAKDLTYSYRFGGFFSKKGKLIGPLQFSISPGECLGIIGESGSGKSTLAQLLVGLLEPASGSLILGDAKIDFKKPIDVRLLRSKIQLVMQDGRGSLHPNFTIRRLLQEVLELKGKNGGTDELSKILHEVGLTEQVLDRKPGSLSGGECLRVSIARALLMDPQVLVCDESTSALDAVTRDSLIDLLDNLMVVKSLAIVFISHDEYLVKRMSSQLIVMSDGKVVEQGPTADLVTFPTHEVTKKIFSHHATLRGGSSSLS